MSIRYRPAAVVYRSVSVVLIATGIARILGVFSGAPSPSPLTFYTVLSNLLCLAWMIALVVVTIRDLRTSGPIGHSTPAPRFGGAVMEAITVTMLIYLVVLVPTTFVQGSNYEPFTLTDNLIHIITPCLVIGDWLLFSPKGTFRWIDPLLWALIPYAYLVFAFTWGALGGTFGDLGRYPYPFMNIDVLGVGGVALWIAGLTAALIAVGYVYVVIDRVLGRAARDLTGGDGHDAQRSAPASAAQSPELSATRPR